MMTAAGVSLSVSLFNKAVKHDTVTQAVGIKQTIIRRLQMPEKHVTIAVDGWTNVRHDKVTNIVLLCDGTAC